MRKNELSIVNFDNYRGFFRDYYSQKKLAEENRKFSDLSKLLILNKSFISNVMKGVNSFSREHAFIIGKHLHFSEAEIDYFQCLIDLEKCRSVLFRKHLKSKLLILKEKALAKKGATPIETGLDDYSKSIFFSNWSYAAVHLIIGFPEYQRPDEIAKRFGLQPLAVKEALDFLVSCGMAGSDGEKYRPLKKSTSIESSKLFKVRHQLNWRLKAMDSLQSDDPKSIHFSAVLRISNKAIDRLRVQIENLKSEISKILEGLDREDQEDLVCLNLDFYKF